jgi:hypothetical protein
MTNRWLRCFLALAISLLLASPAAADDRSGAPAMAESGDPDDMVGDTEDPDEMEGHSSDPDRFAVESEDPDDLTGHSEDPDDMRGEAEDPDEMEGRSHDLSDLSTDRHQQVAEVEIAPLPEPPGAGDGVRVQAAWHTVESSTSYLDSMNDTYQNMLDTNYPRGDRRAAIISERNDAIEAANGARAEYSALRDQ